MFGLGAYLLISEMTYVYPDATRTLFMGTWLVDNREGLLWSAKILTIFVFILAPITIGLNVSGVVRGNFLYFLKLFFLSAVFVCFGVVLFSLLFG